MRDAAIVFAAQFFYVMLLGLQTINVSSRLKVMAMGVSALLGVLGWEVTAAIARVQDVWSLEWWAFITAGPAGIVTSITVQPKLQEMYERAIGKRR